MTNMTALYFAAVILLINIALWIFFFYKLRNEFSPARVLDQIRSELDKLLMEVMRESESNILLIEARIQGLKDLIAEADKRIRLADNEEEKRTFEKKVLSQTESVVTPSPKSKQKRTPMQIKLAAYEEAVVPSTEVTEAVEPKPKEDPHVEVAVEPSLFALEKPEIKLSAKPIPQKKSMRDSIMELSNMNFSPELIAEKLNIPVNEVQLAINLGMVRRG